MRTCSSLRIITNGGDHFMDVDLAERAGLLQPWLQFGADGRDLVVRLPILAQQIDCRAKCVRVAFKLVGDRPFLYEEPAAGPDERGDALEGGPGIRELCVRDFLRTKPVTRYKEKVRICLRRTCTRTKRTWTTSKNPPFHGSGSARMLSSWKRTLDGIGLQGVIKVT